MPVRRVLKWTAVALLLAALVAGVVYRSALASQARAFAVLLTVIEAPVLSWSVELITDEPTVSDAIVAGEPTTVVRPEGSGPWPAIVFVNGATRRGRHHPDVQGLARGLGRAGYLALVPDLPGLRTGEISTDTVARTLAVARATASHADAEGGRVALFGVSVGATLALLAAEDPALAPRVSVVAGIAPYTDIAEVIRLATTGFHRRGTALFGYETESYVALVVARSLAAALTPGRDRRRLLGRLRAVDDLAPAPLGVLRGSWTRALSDDARMVVALLRNRDPRRFDRLYGRLPSEFRARMRRLSPIAAVQHLRAPVEIASAPHDKYFPLAESRALARRARDVRITVTSTLEHAIPEPSPGDLADLVRFDAFIVRALRRAREGE
jgi:pimeloyl-ACP methyl ester carboxylesterase